MHAPTRPRLCRADGQDAGRNAALDELDRHIDNLKACVHWLIAAGVTVLDADLRCGRARPVVTVAPSPYLHTLFLDDCANTGRLQQGSLVCHIWQAVRFDVTVKWEEVVTC